MSAGAELVVPFSEPAEEPARARGGGLARAEDLLVSAVLAAMMTLPLLEIVLRALFRTGISGSASLVQHLTLVAGMFGAVVAAREGRLISLATAEAFRGERVKAAVRTVAGASGAAVSGVLAWASFVFVLSEREAGGTLVRGVPLWVAELVLPLGFGAIAVHLVWRGAGADHVRKWVLLGACAVLAGGFALGQESSLVAPLMIGLLAAAVLGAPVFAVLGGAALILFRGAEIPLSSLAVDHYRLVTNPTLPAIPLFTLAGYFLAEGGASRRLVRVFDALIGCLPGGPAIATAVLCAFFTSFTGASGVTILALGGLLMPVLSHAGYSEKSALGILTGAGSLGVLFPPCLPLILYAVVANRTLEEMFLGGLVPGILLVTLTCWWGARGRPRNRGPRPVFDPRAALRAVAEAKWELLLPFVALAALFSGVATAVEAAAAVALYAFVVETVVYRDLAWKDVPRVMAECGLLVGGVLLILGVALGFTDYLIDAQVAETAVEWVTRAIHSRWAFLVLLNGFLLVVGCLMDIYSAIVVVVPLIVPMGAAFGVDPVHLGIIFLANMELGYLTPPVGMNLFLSAYRFDKPLGEVVHAVLPVLLVLLFGVLVITYFPPFSTALPRWLG
ncbi:MAG: TRAP transporter large permease subunit [Deltaproteobacteria bacterium]|nr:TRAP transporter large permease subunit [Deltaproteobacteria bacterium]